MSMPYLCCPLLRRERKDVVELLSTAIAPCVSEGANDWEHRSHDDLA